MTLALPLPVPFILGHYWSFGSIECRVGIQSVTDFTAINYSTSLDVTDVYGTRPQKLGTTRGKQNAEGSLEMYGRAWEQLRSLLGFGGIGYGEVRVPIIVTYGEIGSPVKTDILEGCRIVKIEYANAEGTDPMKVTATLNIMRIFEGVTGSIAAPIGIGF
jgi:hypothetical protein